jgi:hypothetical protein
MRRSNRRLNLQHVLDERPRRDHLHLPVPRHRHHLQLEQSGVVGDEVFRSAFKCRRDNQNILGRDERVGTRRSSVLPKCQNPADYLGLAAVGVEQLGHLVVCQSVPCAKLGKGEHGAQLA